MKKWNGKVSNILFVCLGNICRSPIAEEVMRTMLEEKGLMVKVDSAGMIDYHEGELADRRMREAAAKRGYYLTHRSRPVVRADFDRFDLIVAMDDDNYDALGRVAQSEEQRAKISRAKDWINRVGIDSVPDPYYGGEEGFERCIDLVEICCENILKVIE